MKVDRQRPSPRQQTPPVLRIRDKIAFYGAGWQIHAEDVAGYIAGRERGDTEERWGELVPPYQELAASVSSPA